MPWSNENGSGGGGGKKGNNQDPWGSGPQGSGPNSPDLEELLRKSQDKLKQILPGGGGSGGTISAMGAGLIAIALVLVWLATGFYTVKNSEVGLEILLGTYSNTTTPGLNYNYPYPIGQTDIVDVTTIREILIGARGQNLSRLQDVPEESLMLTGDENIVDVDFKVQWRIVDARKYVFDIQSPDLTVKLVAESAMREVVGQNDIQPILTELRGEVESQTHVLMQAMLDSYNSGVEITAVQLLEVDPPRQVIDAFRDVQAARADEVRLQNEAEAYANKLVPEARGEAASVLEGANAYKSQTVSQAKGEADRFLKVYSAYKLAPDITRKRLYLETMEKVMARTNKTIIDSSVGGTGVVPFLPLGGGNPLAGAK